MAHCVHLGGHRLCHPNKIVFLTQIIFSMPDRCRAFVAARGGHTWPQGYKTWVHSQTKNKAHWLNACGHVSASSQSLCFILSLRMFSSFITSRHDIDLNSIYFMWLGKIKKWKTRVPSFLVLCRFLKLKPKCVHITVRSVHTQYTYTTLTNISTKYIVICKVYTDVGGIK